MDETHIALFRVKEEDGAELSTFCRQLKLLAPDGKNPAKGFGTKVVKAYA